MNDLISRQAAIDAIHEAWMDGAYYTETMNALKELPSAQRKGKWLEKEVISVYENEFQLQSCKCSECDRYETSPYIYYFSEPNFCSYCGADMRGEQDES